MLRYTSMLLLRSIVYVWRDVRAGRRSTIGNRVCAKSASGVRIPISPPDVARGGVAERLNAAVSKTVSPARVTGVRIPPSPPFLIPYFPILTCANNAQEMLVVPFTALIVTNRVFSLSTGVTVLCLSMTKNIM